jgi:hypothetical protein
MKVFGSFHMSAILLTLVVCFTIGCGGQPQIPKSDFQLVAQLRTAVAAKRNDWLEAVAKKIDSRNPSGSVSKEEQAALDSIVAQARHGNWDDANRQLLDLVNGQHPQ